MEDIHRKYDNHEKVVIASSMPSIEYWFLLHFENTNRFFGTSSRVIDALRKYLVNFDKGDTFLRHEKWVASMIESDKMDTAYNRAKAFAHDGESYSDMWKAIDKLSRRNSGGVPGGRS